MRGTACRDQRHECSIVTPSHDLLMCCCCSLQKERAFRSGTQRGPPTKRKVRRMLLLLLHWVIKNSWPRSFSALIAGQPGARIFAAGVTQQLHCCFVCSYVADVSPWARTRFAERLQEASAECGGSTNASPEALLEVSSKCRALSLDLTPLGSRLIWMVLCSDGMKT